MPYIGNPSAQRFISPRAASVFSGDGSTVAFTLEEAVTTDEDILVSVDGVIQEPSVAYAVSSGTTLTFTAAPSSNSGNNIFVYYIARTLGSVSMPDGQNVNAANFSASGTGAITGNTTVGGTLGVTGALTTASLAADGGVTVDNITIDGTEIDLSSGSLTVDSAANITLDCGTGELNFSNGGTTIMQVQADSSHCNFIQKVQDKQFRFKTNDGGTTATRVQIHQDGFVQFEANDQSNLVAVDNRYGIVLGHNSQNTQAGTSQFSANGNALINCNRDSDDGALMNFNRGASNIGSISSSSGTVSYNAFTGSHWSRLSDNSKPTILMGTIIETIDEMCDWYQAEFDITDDIEWDDDGNVTKTETRTAKISISLPNGKSVGDTITQTFEGKDYTAKIIKEEDNKHTKCKISDTADSKRVYGVYSAWDNDDNTINDMYVSAVGTHVVRINKDVTVSAGDLLVSNGDGTAKVQDDDIIRSKTIGKVLANIKQETYSDDSYTVPCALYCG